MSPLHTFFGSELAGTALPFSGRLAPKRAFGYKSPPRLELCISHSGKRSPVELRTRFARGCVRACFLPYVIPAGPSLPTLLAFNPLQFSSPWTPIRVGGQDHGPGMLGDEASCWKSLLRVANMFATSARLQIYTLSRGGAQATHLEQMFTF